MESEFKSIAEYIIHNADNYSTKLLVETINQKYEYLTYLEHGVERIVFNIDHPDYQDYVLKIAKNTDSIDSNKQEYNNWDNLKYTKYSEWLCPVDLDRSADDYSYILMEKVSIDEGCYIPVVKNLCQISTSAEISDQNVGKHPNQGNVLIDYTHAIS